MSSPNTAGCFFVEQQFLPHEHRPYRHAPHYDYHQPSPPSALSVGIPYHFSQAPHIPDAVTLLPPTANFCMNSDDFLSHSLYHSITPLGYDAAPESATSSSTASPHQWMYPTGMGVPAIQHSQGLKRARSHQRTPSASTVGSNGPASPFTQNWNQPHIANTDFAPNSPAQFAPQAGGFAKNVPIFVNTPIENPCMPFGYMPSPPVHTGGAHQAMRGFAIDHHIGEDFAPDYPYVPRQSMSSHGNNSPATPNSGNGEASQNGQYSAPSSDYQPRPNPNIQLFRTESAAYQDELYNPPTTTYAPTPSSATKAASNLLTPHRNLVTERLNTANNARSHSPVSGVSRERSPFRDGSPLAPPTGWRSPVNAPGVGTAAGMRQQQKEQADEAELAQHRPQLRREPTKTISPKDALLDYNEQEQPSLFQDSIPAGYKQHNGPTGQWPGNNFVSQPGAAFGSLTNPGQHFASFRATSAEGFPASDPLAFVPLPPNEEGQGRVQLYSNSFAAPKMGAHLDANPEFPAHLTSMESSASDHGPPQSSQDSVVASLVPQKPADTRAGTGTYTCTYHGCTKRFDSHSNLQKHKRDMHRSQTVPQRDHSNAGTSSGSGSESPRSSQSPVPVDTSDMTNAAIMARNSQAGPHKCSRINPSTNKPCNTVFSRPYDLTRHEDTIHNNRSMKVRCPMCREEKTFSRNDALTRHMRVVHPEVETFGKRGKRGE